MNRNRLLKYICSGWNSNSNNLRFVSSSTDEKLKLDKVLILSKLTRYDYERMKFKSLSDKDFEQNLRDRGTNFDKLKYHNVLQRTNVAKIAKILRDLGSDVKIVNRFSYDKNAISWADCIVPAGGDGTFLLAASLINDSRIPVVGINSDPNRSEGFLCLPKNYSSEPREAFEKLKAGQFKWMFRSRIRSKIVGATKMEPKLLHQIPFYDAEKVMGQEWKGVDANGGKILPVLALNEIFIGETLSAKVSHLELNFDNADHFTNTKCSGLCICTGTGSTSWFYSINRISVQSVAEILRLMNMSPTEDKNSLATIYADIYNYNLKFPPDDERMGFSIRDMISAGVWPDPKGLKPRGFAKRIVVKSNCDDAYIVVDGGLSFAFNDGALGIFELNSEDNLRTIILD